MVFSLHMQPSEALTNVETLQQKSRMYESLNLDSNCSLPWQTKCNARLLDLIQQLERGGQVGLLDLIQQLDEVVKWDSWI